MTGLPIGKAEERTNDLMTGKSRSRKRRQRMTMRKKNRDREHLRALDPDRTEIRVKVRREA